MLANDGSFPTFANDLPQIVASELTGNGHKFYFEQSSGNTANISVDIMYVAV